MTDEAFMPIYTELCGKHSCESVADKAIARSLAKALICENVDPALVERLAALLPKAKAAAPAALEVTFVDPRLSRLSDQQLADLEALVAHLDGVSVEDIPLSPEAEALRRRDEEISRLWKDRLAADERISEMARTIERLENQLKTSLASQVPANPNNAPPATAESAKATTPARTGNVVPIKPPADYSAFDPYCGLVHPALDRDKRGWPIW
jgi:hypothetical protein